MQQFMFHSSQILAAFWWLARGQNRKCALSQRVSFFTFHFSILAWRLIVSYSCLSLKTIPNKYTSETFKFPFLLYHSHLSCRCVLNCTYCGYNDCRFHSYNICHGRKKPEDTRHKDSREIETFGSYYFFIIKDIIHLGVLLLFTSLQLVVSNTSNQFKFILRISIVGQLHLFSSYITRVSSPHDTHKQINCQCHYF